MPPPCVRNVGDQRAPPSAVNPVGGPYQGSLRYIFNGKAIMPDYPTVDALSLPRAILGNDTIKKALTNPPPGMYMFNGDSQMLEQWVMDHWEPVGVFIIGSPSEDPFANVQLAAQRGAGFAPAGGGGVAPAPRPPGSPAITTPAVPTNPCDSAGAIVSPVDPGATGAGSFWFDTTNGNTYIRDATNTTWVQVCYV